MIANTDYVLDGVPHGDVASQMAECNYDSGLFRPYIDKNGNRCVDVAVGNQYDAKLGRNIPRYEKMTINGAKRRGYNSEVMNATTILRKDEWLAMDRVVLKATRQRLRAWSDLAASNTFTLDGMSKETLEHETMDDPGEAQVSMSTAAELRTDRPRFQLEGLPLPFTMSAFWFDERQLAISRRGGQSLSTSMAEISGRRVGESIEKITIGITTGITFNPEGVSYGRASTVYGYITHPARNTKTDLTTPTGSNSTTTIAELLEMRETLYADGFFGPFVIYNGTDWDQFLDRDHVFLATSGAAAPLSTLRRRVTEIDDIRAVRRLDFLTPANTGGTFDLIMISLGNPTVARAVIGMPLRTVQWASHGGARLNFKVMTIMVPQVRADFNGNSGINHGSAT